MALPPNHIPAATSLTHPASFRPNPKARAEFGGGAELYASHDQAVLGHHVRLVDRVVEGSLDKPSFLRNVGHLERFESLRAELRGGGGVTRRERAELRSEMKKLAGKMHALPHLHGRLQPTPGSEAVSRLYDELACGLVSKTDAVEELNWRSLRKYGEAVSERSGPIYADERAKLRASLAPEHGALPRLTGAAPSVFPKEAVELVRQAIALFPQLDGDNNGVVCRNEAREIIANYATLGLSPSQAATLYSRHALLADVDSPGPASQEMMALEDLQALLPENTGLVEQGVVNATLGLLGSRLADQERRQLPEQMPLYLRPDGPDGTRVGQGLEGSCWFLSALGAVDSESLQSILMPEDEEYRMRFADGSSELVAPLNEAERRVYSRGDGTWSGLMEKGLAQKLGKAGRSLKGGLTQEALQLLTGAECDLFWLNARTPNAPDMRDRKNLDRLLIGGLEAGKAMFTQVNAADFDPQVTLVSEARHAYTITGYDPESQTVSLRNPWGQGEKADRDGRDDGNFTMSLTEMAATFSLVIVERSSPGS